jgi:hypothetical protein
MQTGALIAMVFQAAIALPRNAESFSATRRVSQPRVAILIHAHITRALEQLGNPV